LPTSDALQNGLSTASQNVATPANAPVTTGADLAPPGASPSTSIPQARAGEQLVEARVPLDTPPYYTLLKINHYSRAKWTEVGALELESGVIFPFPQGMVDNQNMSYEIQPLGTLAGMGFDAIAGTVNAGLSIQNQIDRVRQTTAAQAAASVGGGATDIAGAIAADAAGRFGDAVLVAAGLSVNDFMTVMFRGPNYHRRDFMWRFTPRSLEESEALRKAILILKTATAASLAGFTGSAFFGWPRIFQVEFRHVDPSIDMGLNTFRMKPSVCTDVSVNYSPDGTWAPNRGQKPTSVEIRLAFLELEFWLNSNRRARDAFTRGYSNAGELTGVTTGSGTPSNPSTPTAPGTSGGGGTPGTDGGGTGGGGGGGGGGGF
jgi:hypothetical protein